MTINEILFKTLSEKCLKQKDLADYLDVNTSVITNWKKRGNNPPAEYIIPICEFLSITAYELLGVEEHKSEIEKIYNKLTAEDKAIVDIIFDKYKKEDVKLLDSKIS